LPLSLLDKVQPVAALDYFLKNKALAWFALNIIGILPIDRTGGGNPLAGSNRALAEGKILILFPEGSRGLPEQRAEFKRGVALLVKENPTVPVTPIFMHGLGKALPKGTKLFVPFICDVFIGGTVPWPGDTRQFMDALTQAVDDLEAQGQFPPWV
jgi:1-acyl-sn-glycerol-3-phosphate acyltransferase